jgi:GT2 family glycosyltransferase
MDVSILLSLRHRLDFTRACLESLERTTGRVRYEVILTDDASSDGTPGYLRTLSKPRYRSLFNERPRGFAANINAAAQLAQAPVLCLLHNDTVLLPDWLPPMLKLLRRTLDIGCVGNVQREPFSGLIDHVGIHFDAAGLPVQAGRNDCTPPRAEYARWPAVSGACCLVPRYVFNRLGGLDEGFHGDLGAVDFCLRAAEAGYRHYVANRSSIYHHIEAPAAGTLAEDLNRFRGRWGARFLAFAAQRDQQRVELQHDHIYTPGNESAWHEQWELGREARRQRRQDIADERSDGRRYLRKHLARPWRYNFGRVCRALVQTATPRPAAIATPPRLPANAGVAENGAAHPGSKDWALFAPPKQ